MATMIRCRFCREPAIYRVQKSGYGRLLIATICAADECQKSWAATTDTLDAAAASIRPSRRVERAGQLERAAQSFERRARSAGCTSASLRGASSATHGYALLAGWFQQAAQTRRALAARLRTVES